jgi:uncharacterized membrane protein YgcG
MFLRRGPRNGTNENIHGIVKHLYITVAEFMKTHPQYWLAARTYTNKRVENPQLPEELKMKNHAFIKWVGVILLTTTVVSIAVPWNLTAADGTPSVSAAATVTTHVPIFPLGVSEVVKMFQGGIEKDVLVSYIESSTLPFHLTADGIIYLQHLGVPNEVTRALILRDSELQKLAVAAYQQRAQVSQPQPAAAAPGYNQVGAGGTAPIVSNPSTPAPAIYPYAESAPPPVYPDYSAYLDYDYGYPYYYGSGIVIGGGYGWGWGWGGRRGYGWYGTGRRSGFAGGSRGGYGGGGRGGFGGGGAGHGGGGRR